MTAGLPRPDEDPTSRGLPTVPPETVHECEGGWVGRDAGGRSWPCPVCKPHLQHRVDPITGRSGWFVDRSKLPAKGRRRTSRRTA